MKPIVLFVALASVAVHSNWRGTAQLQPYREEFVTYTNVGAGIDLAGTLTLPLGPGPFPAVALITGSGQQDRDETLVGHKPFLVLADYLARRGIAVLRSDDRGVSSPHGGSGGAFGQSTTADFATDVEAAIACLKGRPEINPRHIGLIGHSEGGTIASMVAARNPDVAFIVMLAGTGVPGDQLSPVQAEASTEAAGASHRAAVLAGVRQRRIVLAMEQQSGDALIQKLDAEGMPPATYLPLIQSPWTRYFLTYDPRSALRKITRPVLALNGTKDVQVVALQNLPAIRKALEEAGNRDFEVVEMPGLNHLFQTARTGSVREYGEIRETIAPQVLEKIAAWIALHQK